MLFRMTEKLTKLDTQPNPPTQAPISDLYVLITLYSSSLSTARCHAALEGRQLPSHQSREYHISKTFFECRPEVSSIKTATLGVKERLKCSTVFGRDRFGELWALKETKFNVLSELVLGLRNQKQICSK